MRKGLDKVKEEYTNSTNKNINLINKNKNTDRVLKVSKTRIFTILLFHSQCYVAKLYPSQKRKTNLKEYNNKQVYYRLKSFCEH